jgi:hypothetical protein
MRCEVAMAIVLNKSSRVPILRFSPFLIETQLSQSLISSRVRASSRRGEFDRGRYLLTFPARQALVRSACVLRED